MRRPNKHHPRLGPAARRRHARIEQVRRPVEHVFGTLKRSYGYQRVRYRGLARNTTEMWFKLLAYNLRRPGLVGGEPGSAGGGPRYSTRHHHLAGRGPPLGAAQGALFKGL